MKKKQSFQLPKWLTGALISVIIIPIIAFSWKNIQSIWAAPDKIEKVEKKVISHDEVQTQLSRLVLEQSSRIETNEKLDELRAKNAHEQLQLISELKKKK